MSLVKTIEDYKTPKSQFFFHVVSKGVSMVSYGIREFSPCQVTKPKD